MLAYTQITLIFTDNPYNCKKNLSNLPVHPSLSDIYGYLIHTGYRDAFSLQCSDSDMNAIHDMVLYSLRRLSLGGYLIDCLQIERLGYGGDGNASTLRHLRSKNQKNLLTKKIDVYYKNYRLLTKIRKTSVSCVSRYPYIVSQFLFRIRHQDRKFQLNETFTKYALSYFCWFCCYFFFQVRFLIFLPNQLAS